MKAVGTMATIALAILVSVAPLDSQEQQSDAAKQRLRGPVRMVRLEQALYKDIETRRVRQTLELKSVTHFNRAGFVTDVYNYGGAVRHTKSAYDESGRLVSREQYSESRLTESLQWSRGPDGSTFTGINYDGTGTVTRRIERQFDSNGGKLSESEHDKKDVLVRWWRRRPSDDGFVISYTTAHRSDETAFFDSQGRMTLMSRSSGNSIQRWTYRYDDRSRVIEARYRDLDGSEIYAFAYSPAGNPAEVLHTDASGTMADRRRYTYSPGGALESEVVNWFDSKGEPDHTWVNHFDAAGLLLEKEYRHERWPFSCRWTYGYDAGGRTIMQASYDSRGRVLTLTETTWDADGRKLSERSSGSAVDPGFQVLYEYDEQGRLLETVRQNLEGRPLSRESRRYNSWGDLEETAQFNPDGSLINSTRYDFEYDELGNWTASLSLTTNNAAETYNLPTLYMQRTVEYFP